MACFEDGKNIRTSEIFKENRRNIREGIYEKIYIRFYLGAPGFNTNSVSCGSKLQHAAGGLFRHV